ncbi:MAG: FAD/NAD(P)-binding protein, partial [Lutibacter sp.]
MKVDYIIVGLGLAGLAFSKELEKNRKSYLVFEDYSQNSSMVAGGVYNPVVLKRFTPVWNAAEQLDIALPFYKDLEIQFNKKYDYSIDIYRIFKSVEEQNNWFTACDN